MASTIDSREAMRQLPPLPPSSVHEEEERPRLRVKKMPPQKSVDQFWKKFNTNHPGKTFTILPDNLYAKRAAATAQKGLIPGQSAIASYEQAAEECRKKVEKIVRECRRLNQKYRDPHFDIEADFRRHQWDETVPLDCLTPLDEKTTDLQPKSVKRVEVCIAISL